MNSRQIRISDTFVSPTYGRMTTDEMTVRLLQYIAAEPNKQYRIVVGTDSHPSRDTADFVSAVIVHRIGSGGVYFWNRGVEHRWLPLRQRMYEEALRSMMVADRLVSGLHARQFLTFELEIHVDIGSRGDTRDMIQEVVGMVRGSGYRVRTKPEAYGASTVADRHT